MYNGSFVVKAITEKKGSNQRIDGMGKCGDKEGKYINFYGLGG